MQLFVDLVGKFKDFPLKVHEMPFGTHAQLVSECRVLLHALLPACIGAVDGYHRLTAVLYALAGRKPEFSRQDMTRDPDNHGVEDLFPSEETNSEGLPPICPKLGPLFQTVKMAMVTPRELRNDGKCQYFLNLCTIKSQKCQKEATSAASRSLGNMVQKLLLDMAKPETRLTDIMVPPELEWGTKNEWKSRQKNTIKRFREIRTVVGRYILEQHEEVEYVSNMMRGRKKDEDGIEELLSLMHKELSDGLTWDKGTFKDHSDFFVLVVLVTQFGVTRDQVLKLHDVFEKKGVPSRQLYGQSFIIQSKEQAEVTQTGQVSLSDPYHFLRSPPVAGPNRTGCTTVSYDTGWPGGRPES